MLTAVWAISTTIVGSASRASGSEESERSAALRERYRPAIVRGPRLKLRITGSGRA